MDLVWKKLNNFRTSTQYIRWCRHKKALFTENARQGWLKKALLSQYVRQKSCFR